MADALARRTSERSLTVPRHRNVRVGTLAQIVSDVAAFVSLPEEEVRRQLFNQYGSRTWKRAGTQNSALPGVRGNGITSRTLAMPVT